MVVIEYQTSFVKRLKEKADIELVDIDNADTYKTVGAARISFRSILRDLHRQRVKSKKTYTRSDFKIREIKLTLVGDPIEVEKVEKNPKRNKSIIKL